MMKVSLGFRSHSGWTAMVIVGQKNEHFEVCARCRIALVEEAWAKQPYHAAEGLKLTAARELVERGIASAHRIALREIKTIVSRERVSGNEVVACGIVVGKEMPEWSVDEILAVHLRMHQAEGVLFRAALLDAAKKCKLNVISIPEKELITVATGLLHWSPAKLSTTIAKLGKSIGSPWGQDQKAAATAALSALHSIYGLSGNAGSHGNAQQVVKQDM